MSNLQYTAEGIIVDGILTNWNAIDEERNKFRFANSVLVTLGFSYGRTSDFVDRQIWDRDEWEKTKKNLTGLNVNFYEMAGKHSYVTLSLFDELNLSEDTDMDAILKFHKSHGIVNNDLDIIDTALEQGIENGDLDDDGNRILEDEE